MDTLSIRGGKNQNEASKYSIINLYNEFEQADEQAPDQADEQADEQAPDHIIIKLNLFFNYINKDGTRDFENLTKSDKYYIAYTLQRLNIYTNNIAASLLETGGRLQEVKIYYWAIKELYCSPYRMYLREITEQTLITTYQKTKKYIYEERKGNILDFVNYYIKCLFNEAEGAMKR